MKTVDILAIENVIFSTNADFYLPEKQFFFFDIKGTRFSAAFLLQSFLTYGLF